MKAQSLIHGVNRLGGHATLKSEEITLFDGRKTTRHKVLGTLNGFDVEMIGEECDFFTTRPISKRGYYDPTADYNSGDWTFCHRIKDLEWATRVRG